MSQIQLLPYAWVTTDDFDAFERAIADDATVADFSLLTKNAEERLYQMEWVIEVEDVLHLLLTEGCAITSATLNTRSDAWELQLMAPEHGTLSTVYDFCEENEVGLTVDAIYDLDGNESSQHGLTEIQHESLTTAKEMGYYDIPRAVSLNELAADLDVSHQSLSERLRRGHSALIDRTLDSAEPVIPEE